MTFGIIYYAVAERSPSSNGSSRFRGHERCYMRLKGPLHDPKVTRLVPAAEIWWRSASGYEIKLRVAVPIRICAGSAPL